MENIKKKEYFTANKTNRPYKFQRPISEANANLEPRNFIHRGYYEISKKKIKTKLEKKKSISQNKRLQPKAKVRY